MSGFDLQALLADAAQHLADRVHEDCDVRYVSMDLRSVLERWIDRKMPRSDELEAALRRQSKLIQEPNRTPRWRRGDPGYEVTRSDDERRHLAAGIAAAWANYRAGPSAPPQRFALQEESEEAGHTIFWSVEAALKDRLENGYVTATLRPCAIAFPRILDMGIVDVALMDAVNDAESASEWCDFSNQEEEIVTIEGTSSQRHALEKDLDAMLANTFRRWAEKHHCQVAFAKRPMPCVEICAWKFTGPPRNFEHDGPTARSRGADPVRDPARSQGPRRSGRAPSSSRTFHVLETAEAPPRTPVGRVRLPAGHLGTAPSAAGAR